MDYLRDDRNTSPTGWRLIANNRTSSVEDPSTERRFLNEGFAIQEQRTAPILIKTSPPLLLRVT